MSDAHETADTGIDPEATRIRQRLRALRSRYPGLVLHTHLTHIHDDQAVVRAELTLPDGSSVSAYAAEPSDGAGMLDGAIELAEQRATARALDLLGLGDVPAGPARAEARPEPPPRLDDNAPPVVDALRKASQRRQAERSAAPIEESRAEPVAPEPVAPEPESSPEPEARQRPEPPPAAPPDRGPASPEPSPDPDMADYTWTHFWTWARAQNLSTKGQVEQRIGRSIDNLTPRDVRQLLHEHGVPQ